MSDRERYAAPSPLILIWTIFPTLFSMLWATIFDGDTIAAPVHGLNFTAAHAAQR